MRTGNGIAAVPISSEGEVLGVLALATQASMPAPRSASEQAIVDQARGSLPERSILDIVASTMALLIRNSQLYTQLESQAVLEERNRLAREMHDGLAQSLGFFNFKVQQIQRLLARGQVDLASAALQELRDGAQAMYADVRLTIQSLRWASDEQGGLVRRLQQYSSAITARTGLTVTVDVSAEPDLPPETQHELLRVVQEALANVDRHAHAHHVVVRLSGAPNGATLTVQDDGTGLQPSARDNGSHLGLRIMRERVQSIGGELQIESRPGQGTALHVRIPSVPTGKPENEERWHLSVS